MKRDIGPRSIEEIRSEIETIDKQIINLRSKITKLRNARDERLIEIKKVDEATRLEWFEKMDQMHSGGMTYKQIGSYFGFSVSAVREYLRLYRLNKQAAVNKSWVRSRLPEIRRLVNGE
jgi:hypothetical protein